jgi:hypothetical protein
MCHQVSGSAHANEEIDSLLNKNNFLGTNDKKDSSIKAPLQTYFLQTPIPHHLLL